MRAPRFALHFAACLVFAQYRKFFLNQGLQLPMRLLRTILSTEDVQNFEPAITQRPGGERCCQGRLSSQASLACLQSTLAVRRPTRYIAGFASAPYCAGADRIAL